MARANDGISLRWWREENPHGEVFAAVRRIQESQGDRVEALLTALCLYDDWQSLGFVLGGYAVRRTEVEGRLALNLVRSCCDTIRSEIVQSRPRPMFLTQGGDYGLRRKGERMGKFVEGVFAEASFDRIASQVALDAIVCGMGVVQICEDQGRVCLERALPHELWVDRRDGHYGKPRSLYLTRWVDRQVLQELYPDQAGAIAQARDALDQEWRWQDSESDQVCVVEAWHLESAEGAGDGVHVVCVSGATLEKKGFAGQHFPFAVLKWKEPQSGFYARGLADELRKLQRAINVCLADIEYGQELHTHPKIAVPRMAHVNEGHLTGDGGVLVEFDGPSPPVPLVVPAVAPEVYQWVKQLVEWAYQISGVAQSAARSEKPAGVTSGRAIRLTADLQSKRFLDFARAFEEFYLDVARGIVRLMERLTAEDASYEVVYRGKRHVEKIAWTDVKLDDGSYELQVWPTSILPSTPQGRLEAVSEMVNTGFADRLGIPAEQILKLLDFPDTEAAFGSVTASWDLVEQTLDEMLETGEYSPPEPFYNLSLCLLVAVRHYMQWKLWKVDEPSLDLLRRWIGDCKALLKLADTATSPAPPAPGPAEAPPGAPLPPPDLQAAA